MFQAPTRMCFLGGNIVFACVVFWAVKKIKKMDKGSVGGVWPINLSFSQIVGFFLT